MSTTATPAPEKGRKRLHPYQISIALGIGVGTFAMFSGIFSTITGWKSTSEIHRDVFGGIPNVYKIIFYTIVPVTLMWGSFRFADRIATGRGPKVRPC
jgi:hypothetical protein